MFTDAELDQQLTGSELLLSTLLQNTVQGSPGPECLAVASEGPYDFYQQSNMSEARLCLPVVEQLSAAVKQRLEEWPEHPALVQVSGKVARGFLVISYSKYSFILRGIGLSHV